VSTACVCGAGFPGRCRWKDRRLSCYILYVEVYPVGLNLIQPPKSWRQHVLPKRRNILRDVITVKNSWAIPWLKELVAYVSLRRPEFYPRPVCVGFVVDKVTLWQVFLWILQFSMVSLLTHSFITVAMYGYQLTASLNNALMEFLSAFAMTCYIPLVNSCRRLLNLVTFLRKLRMTWRLCCWCKLVTCLASASLAESYIFHHTTDVFCQLMWNVIISRHKYQRLMRFRKTLDIVYRRFFYLFFLIFWLFWQRTRENPNF